MKAWLFCLASVGLRGQATDISILVLRHCPRSPYGNDRHPPSKPNDVFTDANNFSSRPFPSSADWGVREGECTPQGLSAAAALGNALLAVGFGGSTPTKVLSDSTHRCVATSEALALNSTGPVEVNQAMFDPLSAKLASCSQPDWQNALAEQVASMTDDLANARKQLPALQDVLGEGVAPSLSTIPDVIEGGYLVGGLRVASESICSAFELEETSGLPLAWGDLTFDALTGFLNIRRTYFKAMYGGFSIAQRYASGLLDYILNEMSQAKRNSVLIGHDLNIMALASTLGIESWQCGSWGEQDLPPLAGFMFRLQTSSGGASVKVQAVCNPFLDGEALAIGPARFTTSSELSLADFVAQATTGILESCVNRSIAVKLLV